MNFARVRSIADALLYEGYLLYPYRSSALKNRQRWTFGGLVPQKHSEANGGLEPYSLRSECLLEAPESAAVAARVRFLHLLKRTAPAHTWEEASEREVETDPQPLAELVRGPFRQRFAFAAENTEEDGVHRAHQEVAGVLELRARELAGGVYQLTVSVQNLSELPQEDGLPDGIVSQESVRLRTLASTHVLLGVRDGAFVSSLEPPEPLAELAAGCQNRGAWPVLVGEIGTRDLMLCSPIILYDYPTVAPESTGDLFDGTEIDEILRLRILTLTAAEQRELAAGDARARQILEQTQRLRPQELLRLHGALRPGARVRLCPHRQADVLDLALAGQSATIATIEQDFEDRLLLTVTLDEDPGRDLGLQGQPGHRFFFHPDEVELIPDSEAGERH